MEHSAGRIREEEGGKTPKHARLAQEPDRGETEESPPPKRLRVPNARARRGGEGGGGPPPSSSRPWRAVRE